MLEREKQGGCYPCIKLGVARILKKTRVEQALNRVLMKSRMMRY